MGKKSIETLVGLFVLLGIAGLVFLALKAANLGTFSAGDTYALTTRPTVTPALRTGARTLSPPMLSNLAVSA